MRPRRDQVDHDGDGRRDHDLEHQPQHRGASDLEAMTLDAGADAPLALGYSRSMIVALAMPPPSHIVCRP